MNRIRRWSELSPAAGLAVLRALVALQIAIAAVRWIPLQRVLAWADARHPRIRPHESAADPRALEQLLNVAARYMVGTATCLHRALALHALLGRHGIHSRFRIGVARRGDTLAAHAWVEWNGGRSASPLEGDFVPFNRIAP